MSIDLEWSKLDNSLSKTLVDMLNRQLTVVTRPSFIGPVEVVSLEFGSVAPDVELVELCDIHRDFLEDDEDSAPESDPAKGAGDDDDDDDDFEWVPRKAARRDEYARSRYGGPMDMPSLPSHGMNTWKLGMPDPGTPIYRTPPPAAPFSAPLQHATDTPLSTQIPTPSNNSPPAPLSPPPSNPHPNLQLHLQINWPSDLRITLATSLLINYPSPMFMSLPIKLSVTGLIFTGEVAVAYEGQRKRIHVCILDDQDPYGPAKRRNSTPPDLDDSPSPSPSPRPTKPLPVGQRLLPSIYIESEIGQADKHVLKNVTRVERFIQDVIRKTLEEELVFPNFHTMLMGEQDSDAK